MNHITIERLIEIMDKPEIPRVWIAHINEYAEPVMVVRVKENGYKWQVEFRNYWVCPLYDVFEYVEGEAKP